MSKITVKKPVPTTTPDNVEVFGIERVHAPFHVRGLSALLVNNFSDKMRQQLEDESTGRCELCAGEVQSVWAKYYIQGMRDALKNYHESNDTMGEDQ